MEREEKSVRRGEENTKVTESKLRPLSAMAMALAWQESDWRAVQLRGRREFTIRGVQLDVEK